jgi:hypothetical protein
MAAEQASLESSPKSKTPAGWHKFWQKEYDASTKRLRRFQKQGNEVNVRFLDERSGDDGLYSGGRGDTPSKLNLFHKNTQTMMPRNPITAPTAELTLSTATKAMAHNAETAQTAANPAQNFALLILPSNLNSRSVQSMFSMCTPMLSRKVF